MFGKGKIDINIPKTDFLPGDKISGNVLLALKKPVKAREASISLIGEQTTIEAVFWGQNSHETRSASTISGKGWMEKKNTTVKPDIVLR